MQTLFLLLVVVLIVSPAVFALPRKLQQSRDLEEKVKNLDGLTKRRVLAMHAAGVPHDAIAQKIQYVAGNNVKQASRLVSGIKAEAAKAQRK